MSFARDTNPEAAAIFTRLLRAMPVGRKWILADEHFAIGRVLTRSALKWRYPEASTEEIEALSVRMTLGKELGTRVLAARRARRRDPGVA